MPPRKQSKFPGRRVAKVLAALVVVSLVSGAILATTVPAVKWRVQLLVLQAQGKIYDLSWSELAGMLIPGSGYYPKALVDTRNPYGTIQNIHTASADIENGELLFREKCANCHGAAGSGGSATRLDSANTRSAYTDWWLYRTVTRGVPDTAMRPQNLETKEAWQLVAYLQSIRSEAEATFTDHLDVHFEDVTMDRLLAGRSESGNWLAYSGDFDGKRYSLLDQINVENAEYLQLQWMHQTESNAAYLEVSPIVVDGIMYVTIPPGIVQALDASSGELLWEYVRNVPEKLSLCCGTVNRGVAVHGTTIFWGTLDARLLAIDGKTGRLLWDTVVANNETGYSITSAPLIVEDKVLIGVSGGEFGIRGHLDAYDVNSGERVWRFYTIPEPGEDGSETWSGDSWKTGGAGAWLTGTFDPELNLIYWGTGNPSPLYYGDDRLGDNLFANSVVALDADTGQKKWHFQFTPHDLHDWAANQIPVLVDTKWNGVDRKLLITANRNGFFYVLDRTTGEFLLAEPFVKQNWATEILPSGRPVRDPAVVPTPEGVLTWPSPHGGTNWQSPAYHPETGLFYVAALDGARVVYKQGDTPEYTPGEFYIGSMHQLMAGDTPFTASLKAIDPQSGRIVWQYDNPPRRISWRTGGVLATAGGIVFSGDHTSLYVLDAKSGEQLWRINAGGYINAAPVTYTVKGRQLITIAAGRTIMTFSAPPDKIN